MKHLKLYENHNKDYWQYTLREQSSNRDDEYIYFDERSIKELCEDYNVTWTSLQDLTMFVRLKDKLTEDEKSSHKKIFGWDDGTDNNDNDDGYINPSEIMSSFVIVKIQHQYVTDEQEEVARQSNKYNL